VILGATPFLPEDVVNAIQTRRAKPVDPSCGLTDLPSKTDPFEAGAIVLIALILSLLATLYPAYKPQVPIPVQVLRYE